mmetsp:Transcript_23830/g.59161  ORF Transcript_23830/g.59161 Transcript_23830/m.59161 type:complete len:246 (-) Transcript_23830:221-958(-)
MEDAAFLERYNGGVLERRLLQKSEGGASWPPYQQQVAAKPHRRTAPPGRLVRVEPVQLGLDARGGCVADTVALSRADRQEQRSLRRDELAMAKRLRHEEEGFALLRLPDASVDFADHPHDRLGRAAQPLVLRRLPHDGTQQQRVLAEALHWLDQQAAERQPRRVLHLGARLVGGGRGRAEGSHALWRVDRARAEERVGEEEGGERVERGGDPVERARGRAVRRGRWGGECGEERWVGERGEERRR